MAANGYLDTASLTRVPIGRDGAFGYLEKNTAAAWLHAQAEVLAATGIEPVITAPDGAYRPYARQVYWRTYWCARGACGNAAIPGTSNHGLGTAVDIFNIDAFVGRNLTLLVQIMAEHGFVRDTSESWHFHHTSTNPADSSSSVIPAKPDAPKQEEDDDMQFIAAKGDKNDATYMIDLQTQTRAWIKQGGIVTAVTGSGGKLIVMAQDTFDAIPKTPGSEDWDGHVVGPNGL